MMGTITLVGRNMAKKGAVFTYLGTADECSGCSLAEICHKLDEGRRYRITKVRKVTHPCRIHADDTVIVVEVEALPYEISVPAKKALEGAIIRLDEADCPMRWCPNHSLCSIPDDLKGSKAALIEVGGALECPRGLELRKVKVEPKKE